MDNNEIYNDGRLAVELGNDELIDVIGAAVPSLNKSNIRYIARKYSRLKKCPNYGELRLYGAILDRSRALAGGRLISSIYTDSLSLLETHKDMLEKATVLVGKEVDSLTLDESAAVLGEYMQSIGRYDSSSFVKGAQTYVSGGGFSVICGGTPLMTLGEKKKRSVSSMGKDKDGCALILVNNDAPSRRFLTDKQIKKLCRSIVRIGAFGLIGTVSKECRGAHIDTRALSDELPFYRLLTESYTGNYVVFVELGKARDFLAMAERNGISAAHFANSDKSRYIRGRYMDVPMELVKDLIESRRETEVSVSECDLLTATDSLPVSVGNRQNATDITDKIFMHRQRLALAFSINTDKNAFGLSVNSLVDGILRLAAAGVDRRAICLSTVYEFPKKGTDAETLGEDLAMILGVYRVGIELAFSQGYTETRYADKRRLSCALYATAPRTSVNAEFSGEGSYIGFLPIEARGDGLVDFDSLRRACDSLMKMMRRGVVLSARAVTTEPSVTVKEMENELVAELSDNGRVIANTPCKGILFESKVSPDGAILGMTRKN